MAGYWFSGKICKKQPDETLFVVKRDVKSYGDSVSHKILFQQVEKRLAGSEPFVFELLKQFIEFDYVGLDGENHKKEVGLPTGMPLNSVLENLFLLSIDEEMEKMKLDNKITPPTLSGTPLKRGIVSYMRYGDDIWAASRDFETIVEAKNKIDKICSELGLKWNEEKCGEYVLVNKGTRTNHKLQKSNNEQTTNSKFQKITSPSIPLERGTFKSQRSKVERSEGQKVEKLDDSNKFTIKNYQFAICNFQIVSSITHLGVSILRDGRVVIPAEKLKVWRKDLKLILRRADYRSRMMDFNKRERLRQLIHFANKFFSDQNLRFKKIDYLLTVVTKDEYFIELDRWVAQVILSVLYGKFTKANFRKTPFKVLKEEGLESLYVRRRRMWMRKSNHRGTETQRKNLK